MTNSLEYKNGKLTIPLSSMMNFLNLLGQTRISFLGIEDNCIDEKTMKAPIAEDTCVAEDGCNAEERGEFVQKNIDPRCNINTEEIKYDKSEYYIPFRILDGSLVPYFEECLGGTYCPSYTRNSHAMRTMVGMIELQKNVGADTGIGKFHLPRTYDINTLTGRNSITFAKELGKFPELFWDSVRKQENLVIPVSEKIYKLISIQSSESLKSITPMPIRFTLDEKFLDKSAMVSKKPTDTKFFNPSSVRVIYELDKEAYRCINLVVKISLSRKIGNNKFDLELNHTSTEEVINYLSTAEELNYQITRIPTSTISGFNIPLPSTFATLLGTNLRSKNLGFSSTKDFIEVILDQNTCPAAEEHIKGIIQAEVDYIMLNDDKTTETEEQEIISGCHIYLGLIGYLEAHD